MRGNSSGDRSIHTSHRWPKFLPDGRHFIYLAVNHRHDASHDGVYWGSLDSGENKLLVAAHADASYASGYLFFLLKDVLMAQHLDFERGELEGEQRPTVEKVVYDPSIWKAVFDVSDHGFMAYQLGGYVNGSQLRWFDHSGNPLATIGEPGFHSAPVLSHDGRKLLAGRVTQFGHYSDLWVYDLTRGIGTRITYDDNDVSRGVWSRDDTRILFPAKGQDHYSLYELDAGGAGTRRLLLDIGRGYRAERCISRRPLCIGWRARTRARPVMGLLHKWKQVVVSAGGTWNTATRPVLARRAMGRVHLQRIGKKRSLCRSISSAFAIPFKDQ